MHPWGPNSRKYEEKLEYLNITAGVKYSQTAATRYPDHGMCEKNKDANRDRKIQDIQVFEQKMVLEKIIPGGPK